MGGNKEETRKRKRKNTDAIIIITYLFDFYANTCL